jgi:hypothetical protein
MEDEQEKVEEKELHIIYIIAFVLLVISFIWHLYTHEGTYVPDPDNPPKTKNMNTYINTMHSSFIKAFVFGIITSNAGLITGIQNGVAYGLITPVIMFLGF